MPIPLPHILLCQASKRQRAPIYWHWFHAATTIRNRDPNLYEILQVEPQASLIDIKRQFYALSKSHHPDHNPSNPHASERFVEISSAYATLGNAKSRYAYDKKMQMQHQKSGSHMPSGSYSSASGPTGGRPASGLSRRRTQFRGPPPSFYRNGGWGSQAHKRQAQSEQPAGPASAANRGGLGPGQGQAGFNNDVPHFDQEAHHWTQKQNEIRRRKRLKQEQSEYEGNGSIVVRFFILTGIISISCSPFFVFGGHEHAHWRRGGHSDPRE